MISELSSNHHSSDDYVDFHTRLVYKHSTHSISKDLWAMGNARIATMHGMQSLFKSYSMVQFKSKT